MRVPIAAIFAGCVIPDFPWIVQRLIDATGISLEPISSYAYSIAQASLFVCFFACMAFGFLFTNCRLVAVFAFLSCSTHLLLDSLQDKWGNGVHLLAPFNWEVFSLGVFHIDSSLIYGLSFAGIIPFFFISKARQDARSLCLNRVRLAACGACLLVYLLVPFFLTSDVIASDSRYLQTLENIDERPGKLLELDRETARVEGDTWYTTTHVGEDLSIVNPDVEMKSGDTYSFRAEFVDERRIRLIDWKRHSQMRDVASIIGLLAIGCWMAMVLILSRRLNSEASPDAA
ncbi:MAG: hypothetical protein KJP16_07765 [Gammaproteobacteria bacterium]|nr:hypothetical protein [Gammaproteobacteria bacterium]NNL50700.1 hypothetical protein [Woeseiaceae bacterium]